VNMGVIPVEAGRLIGRNLERVLKRLPRVHERMDDFVATAGRRGVRAVKMNVYGGGVHGRRTAEIAGTGDHFRVADVHKFNIVRQADGDRIARIDMKCRGFLAGRRHKAEKRSILFVHAGFVIQRDAEHTVRAVKIGRRDCRPAGSRPDAGSAGLGKRGLRHQQREQKRDERVSDDRHVFPCAVPSPIESMP